jgi:hypothetical protein
MPAFGALTGGLNVLDRAFDAALPGARTAHVLGTRAVHPVRLSRCLPD